MSIGRYTKIIEDGKADGSINAKPDTKRAVYFAMLACMGVVNLVSDTDQKFFFASRGFDMIEFLKFSMELLVDALT